MAGRRRKASGGRLLALLALLALCAVAVAGLVLGVLAGVLWEEPGLVASFAIGATERVAWGPERRAEELPAVAAAGAESDGVARERPEVADAPPVTTPSPPVPEEGGFAVQVGAFSEGGAAKRLADSLRAKGFSAYVSPGAKAGEARWRVRVGPVATREQAEGAAARLKRDEKLPTWVLSEDAS